MNIIFLHRNFPAQFKNIVIELAKDKSNKIIFITNNADLKIDNVETIIYNVETQKNDNEYLNFYDESFLHGKSAAAVLEKLKSNGFKPDIIYGHSWGETMFVKDVYPDVPFLCYFEWFYNSENTDFDFFVKEQSIEEKEKLRCKNSNILVDLCSCDYAITPTNWQKSQFPKEFQNKIKVIHDGIDMDICKPDKNAKFFIKEKNIELTSNDEVITYATRGMEPYRGFPNFMKAVEILLKKRPKAHFIIAGEDEVFYGMKLNDNTYKNLMLKECDIDLSRVHFVGKLDFSEYIKLLQVSSVHIYLTVPFVLSWSLLEAMSVGCCVVASNTDPVKEIVKNGYNGLLCDFFNINQLVQQVEYSLENKNKISILRVNARKTIVDNYELNKLLIEKIEMLNKIVF